jgi:bifunctional non-homologous end joining protein LigD
MALRNDKGVRLYTRNGHDFAERFPLIVAAVATLPVRSCVIDGETIVSDESGLAVFDLIRSWPTNLSAVLCAFDLLEVDGENLRRLPIEVRKAGLAQLLRTPVTPGIALNEHFVGNGDIVYQQACKLGCEGIVSKRLGSTYRSGRSRHWLKNPAAPAVRREAEEDWGANDGRRKSEHRGVSTLLMNNEPLISWSI